MDLVMPQTLTEHTHTHIFIHTRTYIYACVYMYILPWEYVRFKKKDSPENQPIYLGHQ